MRDAPHPWTYGRRVLLLLLMLALSMACANTGDDETPDAPGAPPPGGFQQTPFEIPPPDNPLNPNLQGCCRICLASQACGDVCIDPTVVTCPTPRPTGCACQG
jgi:hypothetical protein